MALDYYTVVIFVLCVGMMASFALAVYKAAEVRSLTLLLRRQDDRVAELDKKEQELCAKLFRREGVTPLSGAGDASHSLKHPKPLRDKVIAPTVITAHQAAERSDPYRDTYLNKAASIMKREDA